MSKTTLLGAAGEHYVMSQLLREGFIAALAPVGVPTADILVADQAGIRACSVQVKTRSEKGITDWAMGAKHEKISGDSLFYVFLSFPNDQSKLPDLYVVPSKIVAFVLCQSHRNWLARPGRNNQPHKDGDMRRFKADYSGDGLGENYCSGWLEEYRDNWKNLREFVSESQLS
jgi:hypothetical protein